MARGFFTDARIPTPPIDEVFGAVLFYAAAYTLTSVPKDILSSLFCL